MRSVFIASNALRNISGADSMKREFASAKIHDLSVLLKSVLGVEPLWGPLDREFKELTDFAVAVRLSGDVY